MIKKIINLFLILIFSFSIVSCVAGRPPRTAPPPPRKEMRSRRPGPNYFWVPGHYVWHKGHYDWIPGHWKKNRPGYVWIKGHWERRGGHWVWIKGHWRRR